MFRKIIISIIQIFFKLACRVTFEGLENLPKDGPLIITVNHLGTIDAPLILSHPTFSKHPNLIVPVAKAHRKNPMYRFLIKQADFIWLDRVNPDITSLKEIFRRLENTPSLMVIAPEGTRNPAGALIEAKPGAVFIAAKAGAKIVPAAITNTQDKLIIQSFKKFKRHPIGIKIGPPYAIPDIPRKNKDEFMKEYTDEIMCQIAALLPEEYRGFYKSHPRLNEIIASQ